MLTSGDSFDISNTDLIKSSGWSVTFSFSFRLVQFKSAVQIKYPYLQESVGRDPAEKIYSTGNLVL